MAWYTSARLAIPLRSACLRITTAVLYWQEKYKTSRSAKPMIAVSKSSPDDSWFTSVAMHFRGGLLQCQRVYVEAVGIPAPRHTPNTPSKNE